MTLDDVAKIKRRLADAIATRDPGRAASLRGEAHAIAEKASWARVAAPSGVSAATHGSLTAGYREAVERHRQELVELQADAIRSGDTAAVDAHFRADGDGSAK